MSVGVTFLFFYTGGKVISDSLTTPANFGLIEQASIMGYQNGRFNRRAERSVDPTDVSQRDTVSLSYKLSFGRGQQGWRRLIGGRQINTIEIMQTGIPLNVTGASNRRAPIGPIRLECPPRWKAARLSGGSIRPNSSTLPCSRSATSVVLGNWVSADSAPMSADADARLRGSSMLIAEPVRQNRAWPCGRERWGGTEDIRAAVDLNRSRERFG